MRDRLLCGFLLLLFSAFPAFSQGGFTTVSGAIVDPNGIPWTGGTISAQLITQGGTAPTLNGQPFTSTTASGLLGPGGTFTMRLGDNGVIVPSTTTWQFTISIAPGVLPPAGKGPQSFVVTTAINCGTNTPATCTSNAMTITAALVPVPALTFTTAGGGVTGSFANVIDMMNSLFGVKADVRTCIGVPVTITALSPIFTCTTGNFCNGGSVPCAAGITNDVGKRINGTNACCNTSVPVNTNSQIIPNNTTILSVQSSTQVTMSANATTTCTGVVGCFVFWGSDDDAAVAAADLAYQNAPLCTTLLWPPTPFLVKNPHFNVAPPACEQLESSGGFGRQPYGNYLGWGPSDSVMYLDSTFPNSVPCTFGSGGNGCFFTYPGLHISHLGISGGWNQVPNGGGHSYVLINWGNAAQQATDIRTVGFGSGDGTTVGWNIGGTTGLYEVYSTGFGDQGLVASAGPTLAISGGEFSNVNGACAKFNGSGANVVETRGVSFGTCGGVTVQVLNNIVWNSRGDIFYGTTSNGTCLFVQAGAQVNLYGDFISLLANTGCSTNAILVQSGGAVTAQNSTINSSGNFVNVNAGGKFTDLCGNTTTGTITLASGSVYVPCPNPATAPTISSGFGTSPSIASTTTGPAAFTVNVGTGGTATTGVIGLPTQPNGWNCPGGMNLTAHAANRADDTVQTASTVSTVTVQNQTKSTGAAIAWTASDILSVTCSPR